MLLAMFVAHAVDGLISILAGTKLLTGTVVPRAVAARDDARHHLDVRGRGRTVGSLTRFAFTRLAQTNRVFETTRKKRLELGAAFVGPRLVAAGSATRHRSVIMRATKLAAHLTHLLGQRRFGLEVLTSAGRPCAELRIPVDHHRPGAAVHLAHGWTVGELAQLGLTKITLSPRRSITAAATFLAALVTATLLPRAMFDLRFASPGPSPLASVDRTPHLARRGALALVALTPRWRLPIRGDLLGRRPRPQVVAPVVGTRDLAVIDVAEQPSRQGRETGVEWSRCALRWLRGGLGSGVRLGLRVLLSAASASPSTLLGRGRVRVRLGRAARGIPSRRRGSGFLGRRAGRGRGLLGFVGVGQGRRSISRA